MSVPPNQKSLQIIEAFDHFELVYRWLDILTDLTIPVIFHVREVYRGTLVAKYSYYKNVRFRSPGKKQSWPNYLQQLTDSPGSVWIISTIGRRPSWFAPLLHFSELYLVQHDVNYCNSVRFRPAKSASPLSFVRRLVTHDWQRKLRKLMDGARGYIYPTPSLRDYGRQCNPRLAKRHLVIPFAGQMKTGVYRPVPSAEFRIVVPGSVRNSVRDYPLLMEALTRVLTHAERTVEIHFAGPVMDSAVPVHFRQLTDRINREAIFKAGIKTYFYTDGLTFAKYEQLIESADILVSPLQPFAQISNVWEELGKSKISGSVFDAIRFGKRLYVPRWFDPEFTELFRFTSSQDLAHQISQALNADYLEPVIYSGHAAVDMKRYFLDLITS